MKKYKATKVDGLATDPSVSSQEVIEAWMNAASAQIDGCPDNLGSFADILSIEHFETYSCLAENTHVKFTVESKEQPGDKLMADNSSVRVEDYTFNELTKKKQSEDE